MVRIDGDGPHSILVDSAVWAMFKAMADNQGRDRRRIKREVRKAGEAERKAVEAERAART